MKIAFKLGLIRIMAPFITSAAGHAFLRPRGDEYDRSLPGVCHYQSAVDPLQISRRFTFFNPLLPEVINM